MSAHEHETQSNDEELSELDKIIKKEAQEYNTPVSDEIIKKEAEETDKHYTPIDPQIITREAEETDKHYQQVDDATIKQKAESYVEPNERAYHRFCNRLDRELTEIYRTMPEFNKENESDAKEFIKETILEIDGRRGLFDPTETLETMIRDYAIRDANITSKQLNPQEKNIYHTLLAMQKIKQAIEKPQLEQELLKQAYDSLNDAQEPAIAQNLQQIMQAIKKYYE